MIIPLLAMSLAIAPQASAPAAAASAPAPKPAAPAPVVSTPAAPVAEIPPAAPAAPPSDLGPEKAPAVVWSQPVERDAASDAVGTVLGDVPAILIGSGEDALALVARSGAPLWTSDMGMLVSATPAHVGSHVFIHGLEGLLRIVDAASGATVKEVEHDYNLESPGILVGNLYIYEETARGGGARSRLHAMELPRRLDLWRSDYLNGVGRSPSTDGERVFASASDAVRAFAVSDGSIAWTHSFPPRTRVYEPLVAGGRVFVSRGSYGPATIEALDAITGKVLWSKETAARIGAPPSLADGELIVPLMDSTLARFSVADGAELPAVKVPGRVDVRVAVAPHRIYYAAGKSFGALDRATLAPAWRLDANDDVASVAPFKGMLLIVRRDGFLDAVESAP